MKKRPAISVLLLFAALSVVQARDIRVSGVPALRRAVAGAERGDRILLKPGTYRFNEPLLLEGKEDLVIEPLRPGSKVTISGGTPIPRRMLRRAKGFPGGVRVIDLSRWDITGVMQKGHFRTTGPSWSELFADGVPMRLSEWPDGRWMPLDSVVATGISIRFNAAASLPGGISVTKPSADVSLGVSGPADTSVSANSLGIIAFREDRPLEWKNPALGFLSGCFRYGWADELVGIGRIGPGKTIEVRDTTFYGFGFKPGEAFQHWKVLNIPEEVTVEGEYSLDAEGRRLYVLPPRYCKKLELSLLGEPLIKIRNCRSILIRGLELSCSRGDGVVMEASEGTVVEECELHGLGHKGAIIGSDCKACGLSSCAIFDMGTGAVTLDGGDRVNIVRGDNFVEDCVIHDYNRIDRSFRPAILLLGLGNRISRCEIFNSATMAIHIKGNDHVIEDCDIHDVCLEVEDNGAIYNGRNPSERGNIIRRCHIHDIIVPWNVRAIYHDDGACACEVYGNLIERISSPPVQIGGGSDIIYHDNVFKDLDCAAIKIDARLKTWGADRLLAHRIYIAEVDGPAFRDHYPDFASYLDGDPGEPSRNLLYDNVFCDVRWVFEKVVWAERDYNDIIEGRANYFDAMYGNRIIKTQAVENGLRQEVLPKGLEPLTP